MYLQNVLMVDLMNCVDKIVCDFVLAGGGSMTTNNITLSTKYRITFSFMTILQLN